MYAHVHLEDPRTDRKYLPGDAVPDDLPGIAELIDAGSVGVHEPERRVVTNSANVVVREIDSAGIENRTKHVKRFDGDFTPEQIADPSVETPLIDVIQPQRTVIDNAEGTD